MNPFLDIDLSGYLSLLPPNTVTHFEPHPRFCDRFAEHVGDRMMIEVGAGQCLFAKRLTNRGVKVLAVEPRASEDTREECRNFLLPIRAEHVSSIREPGNVVVSARPDHSGWFTALIREVHPESELIYIGLEHNVHIDIPDEIETETLYHKAGSDDEIVLRLLNRG